MGSSKALARPTLDADILGQMRRKFVSSGSDGPALDDRPPGTTVQLDEKVYASVVKDLDPLKGSQWGSRRTYVKALLRGTSTTAPWQERP